MLENITKQREDELTLTFYFQASGSNAQSLFGGSSARREPWEIWTIPFKFVDIPNADVDLQAMEEKF